MVSFEEFVGDAVVHVHVRLLRGSVTVSSEVVLVERNDLFPHFHFLHGSSWSDLAVPHDDILIFVIRSLVFYFLN